MEKKDELYKEHFFLADFKMISNGQIMCPGYKEKTELWLLLVIF